MAELDTSGGGGKGGKVRSKKASTRVDLTAMVDLAFLLITFFMLTTSLNKPQAMDMTMPDKDEKNKDENLKVADDRTMTVLLGSKNKIEWYMGTVNNPTTPTVIDYGKNGIRQALLDKMKAVRAATGKDLFVIIKPSEKSSYKNLVDIFDEVNIVNVQQRALTDITADEIELLKRDGIY